LRIIELEISHAHNGSFYVLGRAGRLHGYSCELRIANPKARDLAFAYRRAARAIPAAARQLRAPRARASRKRSCDQCGSFENLIFEGNVFGIVFLKPFCRGVGGGEHLEVLGIANLLAGVDVDKDGHRSLFSLRLPQWCPLLSVNSRGLSAFSARTIPIRACIRKSRPCGAD
jgi:hypothetical protein